MTEQDTRASHSNDKKKARNDSQHINVIRARGCLNTHTHKNFAVACDVNAGKGGCMLRST